MGEPSPRGYIILARKLFVSEMMQKPPLHFKLWLWMLDRAMWRDGDKLSRGQFVTSIAEMQEAMSYRVGYRKVTPTKDEIRSAYEAFTKATMITTRKTTRGMVISIVNYDTYQNPTSYETHNEAHNDSPAKPTVTPHHREEGVKKGKKKKGKKPHSPEALRLAGVLADLILENTPGNTDLIPAKRQATVEGWADDIEKLNQLDGQDWKVIETVIEYSQDEDFEKKVILTGDKLRRGFNRLLAKQAAQEEKDRAEYWKNNPLAGFKRSKGVVL